MQLRSGKIYIPIIGDGKIEKNIAKFLQLPEFLVDIAKKHSYVNYDKNIRQMFAYKGFNGKQMCKDMAYLLTRIEHVFLQYDLKILYISILFKLLHQPLYKIFRNVHVKFGETVNAKLKQFRELKAFDIISNDTPGELRLEKIALVDKFQKYINRFKK